MGCGTSGGRASQPVIEKGAYSKSETILQKKGDFSEFYTLVKKLGSGTHISATSS
ncbi:MAG: hypothetical protein P4M11_14625 [Candidatus Pacebacteria bacterium]|nr:hypothetical protein [Candidatus Paceibacterota bacterium]